MTRPAARLLPGGLASFALLAPLVAFAALVYLAPALDRLVAVPVPHFYIVSLASFVALAMGILVGVAAMRTGEPQSAFVAAGFIAVAGVFSVHGLATPGQGMLVKEFHNAILISSRLSLFLGGLLFLASAFTLPRRLDRFVARNHRTLLIAFVGAIAAYVGGNLAKPDLLDFLPTGQEAATTPSAPVAPGRETGYSERTYTPSVAPALAENGISRRAIGRTLSGGMAALTVVCFLMAARRYGETYAVTRTPATGALAVGMFLLAEAQVIMALGEVWRLSWWIYHVTMLAGFAIPVAAIGVAYRRGGSLTQIVDGLFVRDAFARIERSFPDAINALIAAIEQKDPYLRGHMRRVAQLTVDIADELDLPADRARGASHAALLHDIGKIGLPGAILHKPGRLTDEEFAVLKLHPERGYAMVVQSPSLLDAAAAIRWHHERLDGTGYPDGLFADAIPIEARVVAVADVWDALTSDRVYRRAMSENQARDIIAAEAGAKLDDACVRALFAVLDRAETAPTRLTRAAARPADRPLPSFLAS